MGTIPSADAYGIDVSIPEADIEAGAIGGSSTSRRCLFGEDEAGKQRDEEKVVRARSYADSISGVPSAFGPSSGPWGWSSGSIRRRCR